MSSKVKGERCIYTERERGRERERYRGRKRERGREREREEDRESEWESVFVKGSQREGIRDKKGSCDITKYYADNV